MAMSQLERASASSPMLADLAVRQERPESLVDQLDEAWPCWLAGIQPSLWYHNCALSVRNNAHSD
jgi:hypothetical protein